MRKEIETTLAARIENAKALYEDEVARVTNEAKREDKHVTFCEAASDLYALYTEYTLVGFTHEQAWELIKILVAKK